MSKVQVVILMGSDSDWPAFEPAGAVFDEFGIAWEARVLSAHRTPEQVREYVSAAPRRGVKVFIAGAGGAAHLAGLVAAHTVAPVIGVPIETSSLKGLDSLLSTVQMPKGVPVATVAIGNGANAALLAVEILAVADEALREKLVQSRKDMIAKVLKADKALQAKLGAKGSA